ncbi:DOPA 4,5-dioxygenase family protein [Acetobacter persici]|nr:DOPA 4,5-dioxygenase family protein [Acetobacter persici]MBS0963731.1 DOPA 4,5-dioxygenase family protein [Acetobacter persici]
MTKDALSLEPRSIHDIASWHAHIYFDESTAAQSRIIRDWVTQNFVVEIGPWHDQAFGPHTSPSWYFGFTKEQFSEIVSWLSLNHNGLRILIHPNTDNPLADHIVAGLWIGDRQPINTERLPRSLKALGEKPEEITPNSFPPGLAK